MSVTSYLLVVSVFLVAVPTALAPLAAADGTTHTASYTGGATAVAEDLDGNTAADSGHVICDPAAGTGFGGACFPYPTHGGGAWSIKAMDDMWGTNLAYRVCLVATGNSREVGGQLVGDCNDAGNNNSFSHAGNVIHNPTRVLDGSYEYILVFLCDSIMRDSSDAGYHTHNVTTGTISLTNTPGTEGFYPPAALCGGGPASTHTYSIEVSRASDPVIGVPALGHMGFLALGSLIVVMGVAWIRQRKTN